MSEANQQAATPSDWVMRWANQIPSTGRILDLACGSGRHLEALSRSGRSVLGIDIDISRAAGLAEHPQIELLALDLETPDVRLPDEKFAGIVVSNYLHRPLLKQLPDLLASEGVLIYTTFARGNEQFGRPRNPRFLLEPGELLEVFAGRLEVLGFEQGYVESPAPAVVQRYCGKRNA